MVRPGELLEKGLRASTAGQVIVWRFYRMATRAPIAKTTWDPRIGIRLASKSDMASLVAVHAKPEVFDDRFRRGEICQLATVEDRPAAYRWLSAAPTHREELRGFQFSIPDDAVYAYDVYVKPEVRQMGVWRALWEDSARVLESCGRRRLVSIVDPYNVPSLRGHLALGYAISARCVYVQVFGWDRVFESRRGVE